MQIRDCTVEYGFSDFAAGAPQINSKNLNVPQLFLRLNKKKAEIATTGELHAAVYNVVTNAAY